MFIKFGDIWVNPAHVETITIPEHPDAMLTVHMVSGGKWYSKRSDAYQILDLLGIATDKATIIQDMIAEFIVVTDTAIHQVRGDIQGRLHISDLDSAEREEIQAVALFLERLLKHHEADRIAAMEAAQKNGKGSKV